MISEMGGEAVKWRVQFSHEYSQIRTNLWMKLSVNDIIFIF